MVSVFFWAVFGMMTGWVASILRRETYGGRFGVLILIGAIGGCIGGLGGAALEAQSSTFSSQSNPADILFAVFGATTLVVATGLAINKRSG